MTATGRPPATGAGVTAADAEELRAQVAALVDQAAINEEKLRRGLARELALIRAESLADLFTEATGGLASSYGLARVTLALEDPDHELRHLLVGVGEQDGEFPDVIFTDSLIGLAPVAARLSRPWLGAYVRADHGLLFHGSAEIRSIALVPLQRQARLQGLLCLGSTDPGRYTHDMGSDLLQRLGAVLGVCLENAYNRARVTRSGLSDYLTGWHSRRYLNARLREELARAARNGTTVACVMIDVDHFKSINDTYGHLAGDEALREVTGRIDMQIRASDTAARFGGDEFSLLLPDTSIAAAGQLAERIRQALEPPLDLGGGHLVKVTLSLGVAGASPARGDRDLKSQAEALLSAADAALYRAKAAGRNRVVLAAEH